MTRQAPSPDPLAAGSPELPAMGTLVLDTASNRTGRLMDLRKHLTSGGTRVVAYLRPAGGGIEWTTKASAVQRLS